MHLPDLRILTLESLVPHEHTDPRRVDPLIERLKDEAILRNPPIVAPFSDGDAHGGDSRFVVLDGANRTTALRALGVPHIVAQVVNYDSVQLDVWHHVITDCTANELLERVHSLDGLTLRRADLMSARAALARREALAFISLDDGRRTIDDATTVHRPSSIVISGGRDLRERTELLNQLVGMYEGCARVQRTTTDSMAEARETFPDASAIVVFPHYEPAEIIDLARTGVRLPAGITRHVLPLRALRLNYPMDVLRSDEPLAKKQGHLSAWIHEKMQRRQVRTYAEPTVMFDE
jgi:hypothetical protein